MIMEDKLVLHDVTPLSKSSIFTILRSFYSSKTGLVSNLYIFPNRSIEPNFFASSGSLNNISLFTGYEQEYRLGGAGITRKDSLISAFGEALERYSASIYSFKNLVFESYNSLNKKGLRAIDPSLLQFFTKEQYESPNFILIPLKEDTTINWVWGHSLVDFQPILVPASMVYIPYVNRHDEPYFNHIVSTGLGFGFYKEEAILSCLHEVIERDCFSIAWLSKSPLPRVDITTSV